MIFAQTRFMNTPGRWLTSQRGITLIEFLIGLVLVGVFIYFVAPRHGHGDPRGAAARAQLGHFKAALAAYKVDHGFYPPGPNGLRDLVVPPKNDQSWKGPYFQSIPLDPWGHPYHYSCPGTRSPAAFDLACAGPDGQLGTADDIVSQAP
jgi:general secretion pathway protein G